MDSYDEIRGQLNPDGSLKQKGYDISRELSPMACVDVVLIPRERTPKVILTYRNSFLTQNSCTLQKKKAIEL